MGCALWQRSRPRQLVTRKRTQSIYTIFFSKQDEQYETGTWDIIARIGAWNIPICDCLTASAYSLSEKDLWSTRAERKQETWIGSIGVVRKWVQRCRGCVPRMTCSCECWCGAKTTMGDSNLYEYRIRWIWMHMFLCHRIWCNALARSGNDRSTRCDEQ